MKYVITAAVAALALFATAGTASAQHPGRHSGHGSYSGHSVAPSHHYVAPSYHGGHQPGATDVYPPGGFRPGLYSGPTLAGPVYGGVVVSPAPVYGPTYAPSHGHGHVPHHRPHH